MNQVSLCFGIQRNSLAMGKIPYSEPKLLTPTIDSERQILIEEAILN